MSKSKTKASFRCSECGWTTLKWVGQCGECQAWGTIAERADTVPTTQPSAVTAPATSIIDVREGSAKHDPTTVAEFDRVLGGGLVPGAVTLMAGEPGVGKSTLLLDVAAKVARKGNTVLYVSGEESAAQVRSRASRIGALEANLLLAAETDLGATLTHVEEHRPSFLIVDSVQTIASSAVDGAPGNVTQIREVAGTLIRLAKERNMATILVGHVTKEGAIAGPRVLEHLVDVVCHFEGDRHSRLRMIRAVKNRYGPTDEVGCFELTDDGIHGLADPSGLFRSVGAHVPGSCVAVTVEGRRPIAVEFQALVTETAGTNPRRAATGLDNSRVAMIVAVMSRRFGLPLAKHDVFASTVGGVKITEPAADLAIALAMASAVTDTPIKERTIALGEVSLSGELRPVTAIKRRVEEAKRLGYQHAIIPKVNHPELETGCPGITIHPAANVREAATMSFDQSNKTTKKQPKTTQNN